MKLNRDRIVSFLILVAINAIVAGGLTAQADGPASGKWDVEWAQAVRVESGGNVLVQRWGDAVLTLRQENDSVSGTWYTDVLEPITWQVSGTFSNGQLRLVATEHDSSDPELDVIERIEFVATVTGSQIEGTIAMSFTGMTRPPGRRPFSGERRGGG